MKRIQIYLLVFLLNFLSREISSWGRWYLLLIKCCSAPLALIKERSVIGTAGNWSTHLVNDKSSSTGNLCTAILSWLQRLEMYLNQRLYQNKTKIYKDFILKNQTNSLRYTKIKSQRGVFVHCTHSKGINSSHENVCRFQHPLYQKGFWQITFQFTSLRLFPYLLYIRRLKSWNKVSLFLSINPVTE